MAARRPERNDEDLAVHRHAWAPLAARQGRELADDDLREIQRNLAALLIELKAAAREPRQAAIPQAEEGPVGVSPETRNDKNPGVAPRD